MSYIIGELKKLFPDGLENVKIAISGLGAPARVLAVSLFDLGAKLVVADKKAENVTALNRELHVRSGSLIRYRAVSHSTIQLEVVDVIIEIDVLPEGPCYAKNRIRPKTKTS